MLEICTSVRLARTCPRGGKHIEISVSTCFRRPTWQRRFHAQRESVRTEIRPRVITQQNKGPLTNTGKRRAG
jgi:hypothetical protein